MIAVKPVRVVKTVAVEVPGLGARIKAARKRSDKTVTAIAAAAGMSVQNWYRIENEKQELPLETLRLVEQSLGVEFGVTFD